jgi:hypothetical protein
MFKRLSILLVFSLLLALLPAQTASAQTENPFEWVPPAGSTCVLSGGIPNEAICKTPGVSNQDLVVYAHGYMRPWVPMGTIPKDQMVIDTQDVSVIVTGLGFAFATTSYRANGLIVLDALTDIQNLITHYVQQNGNVRPPHIYIVGVSEGGLITTLSIERFASIFTGGLAMCGPVGDFRQQINYWGDFRTVFDYEYPGLLLPSAVNTDPILYASWQNPLFVQDIMSKVAAKPTALSQLFSITKASFDAADPANSMIKTTYGLLDYNVNATNDGVSKLGGNPFDNHLKWYSGSSNDLLLNSKKGVARYTASPTALANLAPYQTSGKLSRPLVTMHTTGDEIVPYWHEPLYTTKTLVTGSALKHVNIPISRYGHCNFKASEVLAGFTLLKFVATGKLTTNAEQVLPSSMRSDYLQKSEEFKKNLK